MSPWRFHLCVRLIETLLSSHKESKERLPTECHLKGMKIHWIEIFPHEFHTKPWNAKVLYQNEIFGIEYDI